MVSQQTQQLLNQGAVYQQQLQVLITQKESLKAQLLEIERALEELSKIKEKTVYKASGPIMVKANTEDVKKELEEKKRFINLKIKTLERNEKTLKEKVENIARKLSSKTDITVG